jgi:predicted nuclease of predicted toxin-antitoxin system
MPSFLVDENLPRQLVHRARDHGHEARWVRSVMPGASDREILNALLSSGEHLVTRDIRFANTIFAQIGMEEDLPGVVLIREQRMRHVQSAWRRYVKREAYPQQSMVVLEIQKTRIRRFPREGSS